MIGFIVSVTIAISLIPITILFINILAAVIKKDRSVCFVGFIPTVIVPEAVGCGKYSFSVFPIFPFNHIAEGFSCKIEPEGYSLSLAEATKEAADIAFEMWS